jgi:N-acetylglucosaminyldiphosphoundecaprenol N-acetyl-beta-D-mannosaminyltransferase
MLTAGQLSAYCSFRSVKAMYVNSIAENEVYAETLSPPIPRVNVLGVGVSAVDMDDAIRFSDSLIRTNGKGYICVTGVHGVIEAQRSLEFRYIQNRSFMTVPDGMPMVWVGRLQGHGLMRRVYGPDYMLEMCRYSIQKGYRHFLYGGTPGVAERLAAELMRRFPGLQVVGTYTPPFRSLNSSEAAELSALVTETKPDVFWVGLSTPKQERFMAQYLNQLDVKLMVGVGAAFDIHTGCTKDAPAWMKDMGMQWFHRLLQEPRRLWKRYLFNNPKFIWNFSLQLLRIRKFNIET